MAIVKRNFWSGKNGPLMIAEIGGNHEGNFQYAKKLTMQAIQSGADVVKFQIYSGDGLVNCEGAEISTAPIVLNAPV